MAPGLQLLTPPLRRGLRRALATTVNASPMAAWSAAAAAAELQRQHELFLAVYRGDTHEHNPVEEWMQTYYRRPRPDLLAGALVEAARRDGGAALTGAAAFPTAVFLSHVFDERARRGDGALQAAVLQAVFAVGSQEATGPPAHADAVSEQLDTLLRGLLLAGTPACDAALEKHLPAYRATLQRHAAGSNGDGASLHAALVASLTPPPPVAEAVPVHLGWSLPAVSLPVFAALLRAAPPSATGGVPAPPYGRASRFLLQQLAAGAALAASDTRTFDARTAPALACVVTTSLVDAAWARFHATGDPAAVVRVLDVATLFVPFLEELGDDAERWVTHYRAGRPAADAAAGVDYSSVPAALADDPLAVMRFEASRHALWSLLVHARWHTAVGAAFNAHAADVARAVGGMDALSQTTRVTQFGRHRIALLERLLPTVAELHAAAGDDGIGSGVWPASFRQPEEVAAERAQRDAAWGGALGAADAEGERRH